MYGSSNWDAPRLSNYAQALAHWNSVTPIRTTGERPIGIRRKKHAQIILRHEAVACRLYNTDVVTFHKDGRIVIRPYCSQSTASFIDAISMFRTTVRLNRLYVQVNDGWYTGSELTLTPDGNNWKIEGDEQPMKEYVNLEKAKPVRAALEAVFAPVRAVLRSMTPSDELYMQITSSKWYPGHSDTQNALRAVVEDRATPQQIDYLERALTRHAFDRNYLYTERRYVVTIDVKKAEEKLRMMTYEVADVMEKRPIGRGKLP